MDVIDEDENIKVVAELPGVNKEDIKLYVKERSLTIDVDTPERRYYKELDFPVEVDESSATSTYKNGVLETILVKRRPRGRGTPIKIE